MWTALSSQRQAAVERALLQESSLLAARRNNPTISDLGGLDRFSALYDVPPSDPLLLANAVAARRQMEVANAARRDVLMTEAFIRGREEALLALAHRNSLDSLAVPPAAGRTAICDNVTLSLLDRVGVEQTRAVGSDFEALTALGSTNLQRRKNNTPYFDASSLKDPDPVLLASRRARGGVTEPFPEKLHRMLKEVEETGLSEIISFFPHGRAFAVHNPTRFVNEIMPRYFRQSRLSSFQRQLNLYGFTRISSGSDAGGYYHELFLKGRPNLSVHMRRVGVPQAAKHLRPSSNEVSTVKIGV
jgi:hypothetical protein